MFIFKYISHGGSHSLAVSLAEKDRNSEEIKNIKTLAVTLLPKSVICSHDEVDLIRYARTLPFIGTSSTVRVNLILIIPKYIVTIRRNL